MSEMPNQASRRPRRYIDWRQAAHLLAGGQTPAAAAAAIGVSEDRLMRHFETSQHFLRLILRAGESRRCLDLALQAGPVEEDAAG
ncbi:hypothetical protein FNB15_10295 [Ferrovibrio terrae]|uniref:Uncharacterized protein n=1 Tax=Ferrovibrio terrae TaxID=2594003 RepID=A0A516H1L0_9PROT|nr:hypothetical protein [Ferrovibrio terrae]QDO97635.1 hypothetical protein FNB15_10295 [Ferrovibrio terrae]